MANFMIASSLAQARTILSMLFESRVGQEFRILLIYCYPRSCVCRPSPESDGRPARTQEWGGIRPAEHLPGSLHLIDRRRGLLARTLCNDANSIARCALCSLRNAHPERNSVAARSHGGTASSTNVSYQMIPLDNYLLLSTTWRRLRMQLLELTINQIDGILCHAELSLIARTAGVVILNDKNLYATTVA